MSFRCRIEIKMILLGAIYQLKKSSKKAQHPLTYVEVCGIRDYNQKCHYGCISKSWPTGQWCGTIRQQNGSQAQVCLSATGSMRSTPKQP